MSDSLWPQGLQHTRPPCPSPSPRVYSNSCPQSWWCHPTISSSVIHFFCLQPFQPFPASGSFPVSAIHIRWPKCWSLSFSISPLNEYSGLISFRIDWFYLLAVQGTLKSLLQYHKVLNFFMVQLSHPYMTTGKIIAMIIQTFVSKVMSLFFNMLSNFLTAFLPSSKRF